MAIDRELTQEQCRIPARMIAERIVREPEFDETYRAFEWGSIKAPHYLLYAEAWHFLISTKETTRFHRDWLTKRPPAVQVEGFDVHHYHRPRNGSLQSSHLALLSQTGISPLPPTQDPGSQVEANEPDTQIPKSPVQGPRAPGAGPTA